MEQTCGIGGFNLADTDQLVDDKVPMLRGYSDRRVASFGVRSSQKIKSNLVVFTTVRIINPDGTLGFPRR